MELGFLSILGLGFFLGIKHAIEPDHLIAVSTIASESKKLYRSTLAGVYWGIGHTAALLLIGLILILLKIEIPDAWAMSLEFLVGIMLVYLGMAAFIAVKDSSFSHGEHVHSGLKKTRTSYRKSTLIGLVHGLAGSGAMIVLTMSTVKSVWEAAVFILIFGAGTIIGMLASTTAIGLPFVISAKAFRVNKTLAQVTGGLSIAFGLYYMYNLGITEGLFQHWF